MHCFPAPSPNLTKLCHFSSLDRRNETKRDKLIHASPEIKEGPEYKPFSFSNLTSLILNFAVSRRQLILSQSHPPSNK